MNISDIISEEIPPLKVSDNASKALRWMDEFRVSHLPVIDKKKEYKGIVSENEILDLNDNSQKFSDLNLSLARPFVSDGGHIYEAMRLISEHKITLVPVLDQEENYLGAISLLNIMTLMTEIGSIKETGGIIILSLTAIDYSLAEISQIVESNNAKILSSYITSSPENKQMEVTIKINKSDLDNIIKTFERYEYIIKASYQKSKYENDMKNRYDELMNYLKL